jgi:outer membrane receptor protein involved in Fe transport
LALAGIVLGGAGLTVPARAQEPLKSYSIEREDLGAALRAFAMISGRDVVFDPAQVKGKYTQGVRGQLNDEAALRQLLAGSGLSFERTATGGFAVRATRDTPDVAGQPASPEVIVTARKREENIKTVPVPVTLVAAQDLIDKNVTKLKDFYNTIPGLILQNVFYNDQNFEIRGIGPGGGKDTVAVLIDDAPINGGLESSGYNIMPSPDLDPTDLDRIEVLKGPQGTLYGANAEGGLIKFVTKGPSTTSPVGFIQTGINGVKNGSGAGWVARASYSGPLTNNLAVRVSGYVRGDPGYIDNPIYNLKGVNAGRQYGGLVTILWTPKDALSVKLNSLYQYTTARDDRYASVGLGDLQQYPFPHSGALHEHIIVETGDIKYQLGRINLQSVSGFVSYQHFSGLDYTSTFGPVQSLVYPSNYKSLIHNRNQSNGFTQEFRASTTFADRLDVQASAYYRHAKGYLHDYVPAVDPETLQEFPFYDYLQNVAYTEYAVYGSVDYKFSNTFDIQVGARQTWYDIYGGIQFNTGPFYESSCCGGPYPTAIPATDVRETNFTYLFTPRYRITPNVMIYGRITTGFRPGGSNGFIPPGNPGSIPPEYGPDTTRNYEVGLKGDFAEHKLYVDATVYYIDWVDILNQFCNSSTCFTQNGSGARSLGTEFAVTVKPANGLTISGWFDYDDAELTADFPTGSVLAGAKGDPLPQIPKYSAYLSVRKDFRLTRNWVGFASAQATYMGHRLDVFEQVSSGIPRHVLPAYGKLDLSIGANSPNWSVTVYLNNVTDKRGLMNIVDDPARNELYWITPRNYGITVTRHF